MSLTKFHAIRNPSPTRSLAMVPRWLIVPLLLLVGVVQAHAQAPYPPNAWHPYRGGKNCVQVADANGNFNCSPFVTIDPLTGVFTSVFGGPTTIAPALVIGPQSALTGLNTPGNDLVIVSSGTTVAPTGPQIMGATIRVRPSPRIPGYCRLVVVGNEAFQEWPILVANPNYPIPTDSIRGSGAAFGVVDFPGGPQG